ncbi:MAG: LytR C-terminal domain-containing protein [Actinomycetes bacterium]|jgi:LytR cell envelope-related transcriptional attenuator
MSGGQTFNQRVTIPVIVIVVTVVGLFLIGYKLWKYNPTAAPITGSSAAPSWSPSAPSGTVSAAPTADAAGRLPVFVYNGTTTPGLAKKVSEGLNNKNWVIKGLDNWSGQPLTKNTIFYPDGGKSSAEELAKQVGAVVLPTTPDMLQDALSLVVFK